MDLDVSRDDESKGLIIMLIACLGPGQGRPGQGRPGRPGQGRPEDFGSGSGRKYNT